MNDFLITILSFLFALGVIIVVHEAGHLLVAKAFGVEGFERILAIKKILPTMAEDEEFITMFIDEARISVKTVIEPVADDVIAARSGWLLWLGGIVGLWTVSSLIETIRDILRRAYGTRSVQAAWKTRLFSAGLTLAAMVVLMLSLFAQVVIGTAQQVIHAVIPRLADLVGTLQLTQIIPALGLYGSLFVLFVSLTPAEYRGKHNPKWPGALITALGKSRSSTGAPSGDRSARKRLREAPTRSGGACGARFSGAGKAMRG